MEFTESGGTTYSTSLDCTGVAEDMGSMPAGCLETEDTLYFEEYSMYGTTNGAMKAVIGSLPLLATVIVGVSTLLF